MSMGLAYHQARIAALYAQMEQLELSPVAEYTTSNAGGQMAIKYRKLEEIQKLIKFHEDKCARIKCPGQRALAVFRRRD